MARRIMVVVLAILLIASVAVAQPMNRPMPQIQAPKTQVVISLADPQYTTLFTQLNASAIMTPLLTSLNIPVGFEIAQIQVDFIKHVAVVVCTPVATPVTQ
jgi:hypothetical protein